MKRRIFNKGSVIPDFDENIWRRDAYGHAMKYSDHGNTESEYGWEIDHIRPVAKGGQNNYENLQPLFWKNNREKSDIYPWAGPVK